MAKKKPTHALDLTATELKFLYRVFSVHLSADKPLTEALAAACKLVKTEQSVLRKIVAGCAAAGVRTGKGTPDYGLLPRAAVELSIERVQIETEELPLEGDR